MSFRWSDVMLSPKAPSFSASVTKEASPQKKKKKKWSSPFRRASPSSVVEDAAAAVAASDADQEPQEVRERRS